MAERLQRKLTTIMSADAAEFSRGMDRDEVGTTEALRRARAVFFRLIDSHGGRVVNTAGDGLIAEFPSVVEAVTCAIETQRELGRGKRGLRFRIGLHLGDVIVDGDDLLGEGVNLAARLQSMAEPGSILLSQPVYDQVRSKLSIGFEFLGDRRPHNFEHDVSVYRVTQGTRRTRTSEPPRSRPASPETVQGGAASRSAKGLSLTRAAAIVAVVWGFLFVLDLATGGGFFSQWTAVPALAVLGYAAVSRLPSHGWTRWIGRLTVTALLLLAINVLTWSGSLWAIYPIAALAAAGLLTRIRRSEQ